MKWMRERDLLIAQTMAFVQSVTGRKPEAEVFARTDIPEVIRTRLPDVEAMLAERISPPLVAPKHRCVAHIQTETPRVDDQFCQRSDVTYSEIKPLASDRMDCVRCLADQG